MEKGKLVHLEVFRIIAIYAVMFNHTVENGFFLFSLVPDSSFYGIYFFMSVGCKFAVPLFYMISGALLLKREESIRYIYRHRVLRIFIVLIVTSLFYCLYDYIKNSEPFDLIEFLKIMYSSNKAAALWYLYSYLALLMMLPLLRKLARNLTVKEFAYLAIMSLLFTGIIPILQYRLNLNKFTLNPNLYGALFTLFASIQTGLFISDEKTGCVA